MCYKPIRIINRKIDWNPNFDKLYFEVPCGKCKECQASQIKSWSLRAYYEFLRTKSKGGEVYNFTLTYDDEHLPKQYGIATFCKSDVQKFFKLLRKWLEKDGYMMKGELTYFLTSEYGHLHGRPHYHMLLYCNFPINPHTLYNYIVKFWNRGFVGYGSLGMLVKDYHALQYACKYITKDQSYKVVKDNVYKKYLELSEDKDGVNFDNFFKEFRQFHLQSKHFGECMKDMLSNAELEDGRIVSPFSKKQMKISIPLYIIRKVFYDCVEQDDHTKRYVLNRKGLYMKLGAVNKQIDNSFKKLEEYRQFPDNALLLAELNSHFKDDHPEFKTVKDFFRYFDMQFSDYSAKCLYIYKYVYRDRVAVEMSNNWKLDFTSWLFRYENHIHQIEIVLNKEDYKQDVWNYYEDFRKFERLLEYLHVFWKTESYLNEVDFVKNYNIKQDLVALEKHTHAVYLPMPDPADYFTIV